MPMPNFEEIMLPLLRRVQDGRRYKYSDVLDDLRAHFGLSNSDYSEIRNQGGEPKFKNKTEWAKKDLMEAGLLDWGFAHLGHRFRPFYKGLEDFSSVCIQSGVAENPFLPSNVT